MFNYDDETMTFKEMCEVGGAESSSIMETLNSFIHQVTESNGWDIYDDPETEDKMRFIYQVMKSDGDFTMEMLEFMQNTVFLNVAMSHFEEHSGIDNIPALEGESLRVRALAGIAIQMTSRIEMQKIEACHDAGGPIDIPATLIYMAAPINNDVSSLEDYSINLCPIFVDEDEDAFMVIRKMLVDCYALYGEPTIISLVSDTYVREFKSIEEVVEFSGTNLGEDFLTRPDSDVYQAVSSITYGHNEPIVTTTAQYRYLDNGRPVFTERQIDVTSLEDITIDSSDRGLIVKEIHSFFESVLNPPVI